MTANQIKNMKRPKSLTIAAAVWFIVGLLGVLGNTVRAHGVQIPDANLFTLLIGVGLWKGWRLCHWLALFMATLGFFVMALGTPWALCHTEEMVYSYPVSLLIDQRPHEVMSFLGVMSYLAVGLFATGWMVMVLRRAEVRRFFYGKMVTAVEVSVSN